MRRRDDKINEYWALLIATVFGMLCANAETVNYIIQRAEIDSAMFILAGLVAYIQGGFWKKYHLYLIFPLIGFFAKEMAFVFAPLLFLYLLIFDENVDLLRFLKAENKEIQKSLNGGTAGYNNDSALFIFYKMMLPKPGHRVGKGGTPGSILSPSPMLSAIILLPSFCRIIFRQIPTGKPSPLLRIPEH